MRRIMNARISKAAEMFARNSEWSPTPLGWLSVLKSDGGTIPLPRGPRTFVTIVLNGVLRFCAFDADVRICREGEFFLSKIDSPAEGRAAPSPDGRAFVACALEFDADDVASVLTDMESGSPGSPAHGSEDEAQASGIAVHRGDGLSDLLVRLFDACGDGQELPFMRKHLKREAAFRLLTGPAGREFARTTIRVRQAGEIYRTNSWIRRNFKDDFAVEDLAKRSGMSVSNFHQKFKAAVGMGPLQRRKKLRLAEARRLMLDEGRNVTDAALEVGCESLSQFIRDYRRLFGRTPSKDVQRVRALLHPAEPSPHS